MPVPLLNRATKCLLYGLAFLPLRAMPPAHPGIPGVDRYTFKLAIDPTQGLLRAQGEIQFHLAPQQTKVQFLLAAGLAVSAVTGPQVATFVQTTGAPKSDTLTITLRQPLAAAGVLRVRVAYGGRVQTTQLPQGIDFFQPAWTELTDRTGLVPAPCEAPLQRRGRYTFSLQVPPAYAVVGSEQVRRTSPGNWTLKTPPTSHFALYIAPTFYTAPASTARVARVQVLQTSVPDTLTRRLGALATRAALFYNTLYGGVKPLHQLRLVVPPTRAILPGQTWSYAVPGGKAETLVRVEPGAMGEDTFYIIGHEVAHHWWHYAAYPNANFQSYLNEGFAEYACLCFYRAEYGEAAFTRLLARYRTIAERLPPVPQMGPDLPVKARNQFTYIKTAYTLYLLEARLGRPGMRQLLRQTLQQPPTSHDAWLAQLERSAGRPARQFFEAIF